MSRQLLSKIILGIWFLISPIFGAAMSLFLYQLSLGFESRFSNLEPGKIITVDKLIINSPSFEVPNILLLTIIGNLLLLGIIYYLNKPVFSKWIRVPVILWFILGIMSNVWIHFYMTCLC